MSDFKSELPSRDELCSDIERCQEEITDSNVRFLAARETRRQRIKALQTEIEKVNHF